MSADKSRSSNIYKKSLYVGVALSALMLIPGGTAYAQSASDAQVKTLQAQIDQLQRSINQLKSQQTQQAEQAQKTQQAVKQQAAQAQQQTQQVQKLQELEQSQHTIIASAQMPAKAGPLGGCDGHGFLERKPGAPLTIYTCGGELTAYGNFDVSIDATSKNIGSLELNGASGPVGQFGWMPAISTNLSYLGVRGFQKISNYPFNFVYQAEVGFDISATPGLKQSNSNQSDTVNGALFNRNTFIGLASKDWGAVKIGKTDAPYKNSTAMFNPFSGMIGDYAVVMGNTGGDNRVEFGTRLDHAIWYESPVVAGFQFNALFAPGQNRSSESSNVGAGESDCAGGNIPESGGNLPVACNDGAFQNAASANLSYTNGGFYATGAYEWHGNVNRQSDINAIYGVTTNSPPSTPNAASLFQQDIGDEDAAKVGALYRFSQTGTTIGGIFEWMHRYVSSDLNFQNERTRNGTWLFVSQQITNADSVHFGWAHAFKAVGDPGQHNSGTLSTPDGEGGTFATNENQADMLTAAYKRKLGENLTWYTNVAATINGPSAHYDLGAGGRGVTTDCHDAFSTSGDEFATPRCFTGTTLMGVSTGIQWRF